MNETFKPIPSWEGLYEISNLGNVISFCKGKKLQRKLRYDKDGYVLVTLSHGSREQTIKIHRCVLATFISPCPEGHEVNHINGIRHDNRVENLEYVTKSENHLHAWRTMRNPERSNFSKISAETAMKVRSEYANTHKLNTIAEKYGISKNSVWLIGTGKTWRNI